VSGVSMGMSPSGGAQILTAANLVAKKKQYLYFYGLTAAGKYSIGQWWAPADK